MAIISARPASSDHPDAPDIPPTPADQVHRRATRKAMLRLIPVLAIIYFMSYVDRTNIAMAKTQLQADVGISVAAFGLGAGLFFIAYACLQVPANLIMYRLGARRWITVIALLWGSVTVGMMFVSSEVMFYGLRIALGAFEAGLYPAILFMVTRWFAQKDRATAIGYVQAASCLGVILGAPLGGFLMGFHGVAGLHGWQWMFLIEGVATVLIGLTLIRLLPDRPREARWLGPQEAAALEGASGAGDAGNETSSLKGNLWAAFGRPFILIIGAIYFLNQIVINGLSFNVPAIIEGMDVSSTFVIGILSGVTAVGSLVGVLVTPRIARRMGNETVLLGALTLGCTVFAVLAFAAPSFALQLVCMAVIGGLATGCMPIFWSIAMPRMTGVIAAAGLAFINTIGQLGGFFGPYAFGVVESKTGDPMSGLWVIAAVAVIGGLLAVPLSRALRREDRSAEVASQDARRTQGDAGRMQTGRGRRPPFVVH
ncbi:MFS transporter [Corynebacterium variabile]|uniref:MFS transporter n=2 Tax=Corynebacterium variabile TaxID=1727 RepID=UPI003F8F212A